MKNIFTIAALLILTLSTSAFGKLYKWVDENGKVHYSDKMPPDQIKHEHQELNKNGVVKETVKRALTDEERKIKAQELQKLRELEEQKRLEAERRERERNTILKSYSNAGQILHLKNERISALNRNIEMAEDNLVIQNRNLDDMLKRAADKERSGEVVSDVFLEQIEVIRTQIENQKIFIQEKTTEIRATEEKYDYEYKRYLEYTENESDEAADIDP
ncbi:MAG: DUF4124 domain-containing protein [Marinicella sp.]|nr:DUF4124 domain-containing protein [Xanthomonadales bacterium]